MSVFGLKMTHCSESDSKPYINIPVIQRGLGKGGQKMACLVVNFYFHCTTTYENIETDIIPACT